jgi:hypothetical protein
MKKSKQKNEIAWEKNEMYFILIASASHFITTLGRIQMTVLAFV